MATTPVFLPGESHGQKSLAGYSPESCKESDMTEVIQQAAICDYLRLLGVNKKSTSLVVLTIISQGFNRHMQFVATSLDGVDTECFTGKCYWTAPINIQFHLGEFKVQDKWNPVTVSFSAHGKTRAESSEVGYESSRLLCDLAHILSRTQFSNLMININILVDIIGKSHNSYDNHVSYQASFFLIGLQLLYNIVLVSAVQWSESAIYVYIYISRSSCVRPMLTEEKPEVKKVLRATWSGAEPDFRLQPLTSEATFLPTQLLHFLLLGSSYTNESAFIGFSPQQKLEQALKCNQFIQEMAPGSADRGVGEVKQGGEGSHCRVG